MGIFYRLFLFFSTCLLNCLVMAQNTCATAVDILALPYNSPVHTLGFPSPNPGFTTCGTGDDYSPLMACGNPAAAGEDAVFTFTPTALNNCISITLKGPTVGVPPVLNPTASVFLYDNCPSTPGVKCVATAVNVAQPLLLINNVKLEVGRQYFIVVDGGSSCYPYELKVEQGSCPVGANCNYPIAVVMPFDNVPGSTVGMRSDYDPTNSCALPTNSGNDVVYHLPLTKISCLRFNVSKMSNAGVLYITRGCPGEPGFTCVKTISCAMPYCDGILQEINLPAGDYYFVIKSNNLLTDINFELTIEVLNPDDNIACLTCNDNDNCAPCKNAGFEKLNFQSWVGKWGSTGNPGLNTAFITGAYNDGLTRHTLVTRGNYDTLINNLSVVPPDGGDYAVRLGNCNNNYQGEQLVYSFLIDSNNTNFIYKYAVVLEDPGHAAGAQPFFSIDVKAGSTSLTCANYRVSAGAGIPGFSPDRPSPANPGTAPGSAASAGSIMRYKDWSTVNVPLLDYIGQIATITFTTKDCAQGGHFGYAYLDAACERLQILRDSNLFCNNDTVLLTAPNGFLTYRWNTGQTTQTIKVTKKGVYTVTCTTVTGCVINLSSNILIEEKPKANFDWKFDCKDSVVTFTDLSIPGENSPIYTWNWSFGDGDSSHIQHPTHKYDSTGNYNVTLQVITQGGCDDDTLITLPIDLYMPQGKPNTLDTVKLCEGSDLFLLADTIDLTTYQWTGPTGFSSTEIRPVRTRVLPADSGWYKLKIRIKDCVDKFDSTYLFVEPLKKPVISPDTNICFGDTAAFNCYGGKSYLWRPNQYITDSTAMAIRAWPPVDTRYSVTMFNDLCPDTVLSVDLRVLKGVVSLQMPDTLKACKGGSITISPNASGFDVFSWVGPSGFTSTISNPTISSMDSLQTGYYVIDCFISNNNCITGKDSVWLDLNPDPVVTVSPKPVTICKGDSVQLLATGANTYSWKPNQYISNAASPSPVVKPILTTSYSVIGTNTYGCRGYDTVKVNVNQLPAPNLGPDQTTCLGFPLTVKPQQYFDSLLWMNNSKADSLVFYADQTVSIRMWKNGCSGVDTMKVNFQNPANFSLGPDTLLCLGDSYATNITLTQVDSAIWNDQVKTLNRSIISAGTYWVTVFSGYCVFSDTITVSFDSIPVINIGPDSTICKGGMVTFNAYHPRALSYLWDSGEITPAITVGDSGLHSVTINSLRCQYEDTALLTVYTPPIVNIGPDLNICQGDSVSFNAKVNLSVTYLWNTGQTTASIVAKNQGAYSVIVQYGPCTSFDTAYLNVQIPTPFNLGPDQTWCEDQPTTVVGPSGFDSYWWSSGEVSKDINPTVAGNYSLITKVGLCFSYDTIRVNIDTIPNFVMPQLPAICDGDSLLLNAPITATNYLWSTGETGPSIQLKKQGFYSLFISNGLCSYIDSSYLEVVQPPSLYIGPDSLVCIGTGVDFGQEIPGSSYKWNTGEQTPYIRKYDANSYSVEVTYKVCVIRDTAELIVAQMPQPNLGDDLLVCEGTTVVLRTNTFGDFFQWSTGSTDSTITISKPNSYSVVVHNGPCVNADTVLLAVQQPPLLVMPPDVELCPGEKFDIVPVTNAVNPIYSWSNGSHQASLTVADSGYYYLVLTAGVCDVYDSLHVTVWPNPNVKPMRVTLCPGDSAKLALPKHFKYFNIIDMSPFLDSVIFPKEEFNLFIYDTNGCRWQTSLKAETDLECDRDIYVPNTFTPNGDGANDYFKVVSYQLKLVDLMIFDRWGELIFQTDQPAIGWDGKYKGEICKTDVYEWKVTYIDAYGKTRIKIGHVNLLR